MPSLLVFLVFLLGFSALFFVYIAAYARQHARVPGATDFFWLMLATAIYTLAYAFELSFTNLRDVLFIIRVEYLGIAFIPTFLILFVLGFTRKQTLKASTRIPFLVFSFITWLIALTVDQHHLLYIDPRMTVAEHFVVLTFERGIWYYVNYVYLFIVPMISVGLLAWHAYRSEKRRKRQALLLIGATLLPALGGLARLLRLIPEEIDATPFILVFANWASSIALFKYGLFELVPAARELALDSINEGFMVFDHKGNLLDYNRAVKDFSGSQRLILDEPLPADYPLTGPLQPLLQKTSETIKFSIDEPEKGLRYYQARAKAISAARRSANGLAVLISDITETIDLMEELSLQASMDELTGIYNRRYLIQFGKHLIQNSCQNQSSLGVVLVDLDNFKDVNDQQGHPAGDEVLKGVAACFRDGIRHDDLLGRFGGDEFAIFMPDTSQQASRQAAERLRRMLAERVINTAATEVTITASFGVYCVVADENTTIENLLNLADRALYQAKSLGGNQVILHSP